MSAPAWSRLVATGLGSGLIRPAPGTWGSLAALPPAALLIWWTGFWGLLIAIFAVTALGSLAAERYAQASGQKDPSEVVIDEVAGQWIALLPLAIWGGGWIAWLAAFLLFRLFDITKPWPCRPLEALPGGPGIMADDLMAGLYAAIAVTGLLWAMGGLHA